MAKASRRRVKIIDVCPASHNIGDVKKCFVGVSMFNNMFREKNMREVLKWIDSRFESVEIIIADTLHRYNEMAINSITEEDALIKTQKFGNGYFNMVLGLQDTMEKCNIKISRWDDHRNNEQLKYWKDYYLIQYQEDDFFYQQIKLTTEDFHKRLLDKRNIKINISDKIINPSVNYLLEELAFISYYIQDTLKVSVYPGNQLDILKKFTRGAFPKIKSPLINGIYIDLNVKKIK